jgi:hypothetical protein
MIVLLILSQRYGATRPEPSVQRQDDGQQLAYMLIVLIALENSPTHFGWKGLWPPDEGHLSGIRMAEMGGISGLFGPHAQTPGSGQELPYQPLEAE